MRLIFFIVLSGFAFGGNISEIEKVRVNYAQAALNKALCREMIKKLKDYNDPVQQAYLGAFQTIWAKHTLNPFEKLKTFKKGKANIEESVALAPLNAEIRLIRLSIQLNAPGFLGYNDNIEEDRNFILDNKSDIKSESLQKMIDECIKIKK
ncbi:hypothetical protein ACX0HA_06330 [Flavobacterium hauense]